MEKDLLEALHRVLAAGGAKLTATQVGGDLKPKEQKALVGRLIEAGYLAKTGAKYDVTDAGRATWHEHASPAERTEIEDRPILALLQLLEEKQGKLVKGDLTRHAAGMAKALERRLIADAGKNTYTVLPAGEALRVAQLPLAEQVAHAQQRLAAVQAEVAAVAEKVAALLPPGPAADFEPASLLAPLEARLAECAAYVSVQTLGAGIREELARNAEAQRDSIAGCRQEVEQVRSELEATRSRLGALETTLNSAVEKLKHATPPTPAPSPTTTPAVHPTPTSDELWTATREAYEALTKEGWVKIPELFDAVHARFSQVTLKQFHDALLRWKEQDRLTLQLCSNRHAEARAAEGIEGQKGLLFYVEMR